MVTKSYYEMRDGDFIIKSLVFDIESIAKSLVFIMAPSPRQPYVKDCFHDNRFLHC